MRKYINKVLIALVSGIMLLPVTEIIAQSVIEEITVTARQREESLRDVPGTVTVLTGDQIERSGIQRAADFINLTPLCLSFFSIIVATCPICFPFG